MHPPPGDRTGGVRQEEERRSRAVLRRRDPAHGHGAADALDALVAAIHGAEAGVSVGPGAMQLTRIPVRRGVLREGTVSAMTPALAAVSGRPCRRPADWRSRCLW